MIQVLLLWVTRTGAYGVGLVVTGGKRVWERIMTRVDTIKASIPRPVFQGDIRDSDNHGGQQYAPLMDIDIPGL